MPGKSQAAKIVKGAKSKVAQSGKSKTVVSGKVNSAKAEAGPSAKTNTSKKIVKKPKVTKKKTTAKPTSNSGKTTLEKATTSKSAQNILETGRIKNGVESQSKQKGKKLTKIHPEVEKLVRMLTEKLTQIHLRTTASDLEEDEDNRSYETSETETDGTDLSDDEFSSESDCSDCSDGDDERDELDDSDSTDDDIAICSGCSTCGFSTKEFNVKNNTKTDNGGYSDNYKTISDFGWSESSFETTDLEEIGTKVTVAKLKKKPLKKRSAVVKPLGQSKKKPNKKTTKPKTKIKTKKRKKSLRRLKKPTTKLDEKNKPTAVPIKGRLSENPHTLIVSNKVTVKREHSFKWEPTASTSHACVLPSYSKNSSKEPRKALKTMLKSEPLTSDIIPPVTKIDTKGAHYGMLKSNNAFSKTEKKSAKRSSINKIWCP